LTTRSTPSSPSRRDPVAFIEKVLGLDSRQFQRDWLTELFREEKGKRTYTRALWGQPRGNGKSHMAAAVAGYMLLADRPRDNRPPQVVIAAGSWQQGMITFKRLREFIEGSPLANMVTVLSGRGFMRIKGGAELFVVSAEGPLQHGLEPTCVVFDEVWNQRKRELYEALIGGMLKRPEPIMVCISSAGYSADSLLWEMCKEGESGNNQRLFYQWHDAPEDAPYDDPKTWALANPALSCEKPFLMQTGLEDSLAAMHESEFRRWHLGQWTAGEEQWINAPLWDACNAKPELGRKRATILGVDASIRHDSTVVATVQKDAGTYHTEFEVWEPVEGREVKMELVVEHIRQQCRTFNVTGVCFDPYFMHHAAQILEDEGVPMIEWKQDNARMVPATRTLHEAVVNGKVRHGGHPIARSHALAAGVCETERGLRIKKTAGSGPNDALVALAMAVEWASRQDSPPARSVYEDRGVVVAS
jgi:phage terminase large subunit-like protein